MIVHPAKTQISLGIRPDWSESSLSRLIWVFAGCTDHFVGFVKRQLILDDSTCILIFVAFEHDIAWITNFKCIVH